VAGVDGKNDRGPPLGIDGIDIRTVLEEETTRSRVTIPGSAMQRRFSRFQRGSIHTHARIEQALEE